MPADLHLDPKAPPPPERLVTVCYRGRPRRAPQRLTKQLADTGRLAVAALPPASRAMRKLWAEDLARGINPWAEHQPPKENHP